MTGGKASPWVSLLLTVHSSTSAVCNSPRHWASPGLSCWRWSKHRKDPSSQVLWTWCLIQDCWIERKTLCWTLLAPLLSYYCSKEGCIALTLSLLIKSYELDSKSDNMNQHNFFSPLSLVMLEGKNPFWPCWLKFKLSQSQGRSCTSLQIQTPRVALCLGATKTGPQACEFNPPEIEDFEEFLKWDFSWSKIYYRHWFCSMEYLQETSTDSLARLKINWIVFWFFGMKSESSASPAQTNHLVWFGFSTSVSGFESFIHCWVFLHEPVSEARMQTGCYRRNEAGVLESKHLLFKWEAGGLL